MSKKSLKTFNIKVHYFPESHYQPLPPPQPKPISPSPQYPPSNYPPPAPQPTPSSSYNHPEPTYTPPFKPIYTIPDPIIVKPKPIKPEPVYVKPEPVYVPAPSPSPSPSPSPEPSYVSSTISNSYEVADTFSFPEEPEDDSYGTPVGQTIDADPVPAVPAVAAVPAVPAVPEAVPAVPAIPDNHVTVQTERPIIIRTETPKELHGQIIISHIPEEYSQNPDHIHHITGDTLFYKDLGKIDALKI